MNISEERLESPSKDDSSYEKVKIDDVGSSSSKNKERKSVRFQHSSTIPKTESFHKDIEELKTYIICPWYRSYRIWWAIR